RYQMTRNGHNELIYDIISDAVKNESLLILNADDPLASAYGKDHPKAVYYSMDRNRYSSDVPRGRYNDSAFCPICKHPLKMEYRTFENAGRFFCENCGHSSHEAKYRVTDVDLDNTSFTFDGKYAVSLKYKGLHNIYNYLAAYTVCCEVGIEPSQSAAALADFVMNNGRLTPLTIGGRNSLLLISKHENSVSYNSSIDYTLRLGKKVDVMIMVNSISRKYYTGETSWLYDIDFERFDCDKVGKIILCGKYCRDLEFRLTLGGFGSVNVYESPEDAVRTLKNSENDSVIMTCFADRARLMQAIESVEGEEKR
ncbi:MAG: DUF1727 domain-containing protein, partial [Firmicutes bacterium]|nr:DUF1727 domain-containing protein [Candidatus Colimorpha enterica]